MFLRSRSARGRKGRIPPPRRGCSALRRGYARRAAARQRRLWDVSALYPRAPAAKRKWPSRPRRTCRRVLSPTLVRPSGTVPRPADRLRPAAPTASVTALHRPPAQRRQRQPVARPVQILEPAVAVLGVALRRPRAMRTRQRVEPGEDLHQLDLDLGHRAGEQRRLVADQPARRRIGIVVRLRERAQPGAAGVDCRRGGRAALVDRAGTRQDPGRRRVTTPPGVPGAPQAPLGRAGRPQRDGARSPPARPGLSYGFRGRPSSQTRSIAVRRNCNAKSPAPALRLQCPPADPHRQVPHCPQALRPLL